MAIQAGTQLAANAGQGLAVAPIGVVTEIEREIAGQAVAQGGAVKAAAAGTGKGAATAAATTAKGGTVATGVKAASAVAPAKGAVVTAAGGGAATSISSGMVGGPVGAAISGNSFLAGKGLALGLGLGLGAWGPVIIGVAGLAGAVSLFGYVKRRRTTVAADAVAS
jgi:hypothetical protein